MILTVINLNREDIKSRYPLYTSTIIQTLKFRSGRRIDPIYNIVEVEEYYRLDFNSKYNYINRRIYNPLSIIYTVYIIP